MASGWKLDPQCRNRLLALFPPRYDVVVADHVTRTVRAGPGDPLPPSIRHARVVGHVDDGQGVQTLVVAIDGSTQRPDGGVWHITWSLGAGRPARDSSIVLAEMGWTPCDGGSVRLMPYVD